MSYGDEHNNKSLENLERAYRRMESEDFEGDFKRRKDISGVEEQINYWYSDNILISILSEQHELLISERQGQARLMESLNDEVVQLRRESEEKRKG